MTEEPNIERTIVSALIASDEFAMGVSGFLRQEDMESETAKILVGWCLEYVKEYNKAPYADIEQIFLDKSEERQMSEEQKGYISDILAGLSSDWSDDKRSTEYLVDVTKKFVEKKRIQRLSAKLKSICDKNGDSRDAEAEISKYLSDANEEDSHFLDPLSNADAMRRAFGKQSDPLIILPKYAGEFLNSQFTRSSFVAFMGPEKRGKTFWLMELAMRGVMCGRNVAFFQAGDMTEDQQLKRIGIYLNRRSDKEKYCMPRFIPEVDCWHNQTDNCTRPQRECRMGILPTAMEPKDVKYDMLVEAYECNPEYEPCRNCKDNFLGAPYLRQADGIEPLTADDAARSLSEFRAKYKGKLGLFTYPNNTLTVRAIQSDVEQWCRSADITADIVIVDYADLLVSDIQFGDLTYRHTQNRIWQDLRKISQELKCLVITATQSASSSYGKDTLSIRDFSEDKRKFAHVTAMYALNQNPEEKRIGILRLGELVVRDDEYDGRRQIKILQCLQRGRPLIGSFF